MALHAHVYVNGNSIGFVYVQRRAMEVPPDGICSYDWKIEGEHGRSENLRAEPVRHNYHDGGWVLLAKVLAAAGYNMDEPQPTTRRVAFDGGSIQRPRGAG